MFNTFFQQYISSAGKKVPKNIWDLSSEQLNDGQLVLIPVCSSSHWHFLELDWMDKTWKHYSSLLGGNSKSVYAKDAEVLMNWVNDYCKRQLQLKQKVHLQFESVVCPQQQNR